MNQLMKEIKSLHTFSTQAYCQDCLFLERLDDLEQLSKYQQLQQPWVVIGEGSNLLFVEDFQGLLVCNRLKGRRLIELPDAWAVEAAAGENWHELVLWLVEKSIGGLENLALIPGTVGAAPVQNIGAYGAEFRQFCEWVEVWDTKACVFKRLSAEQCGFGYRDSCFKHNEMRRNIVTRVGLRLMKNWQPRLDYGALDKLLGDDISPLSIFNMVCKIRSSKLPNPELTGNAGSFFKNPIVSEQWVKMYQAQYEKIPIYPLSDTCFKVAAGWMIEQAGLKGFRLKGAGVDAKQALVLINASGNATGKEILELAKYVRQEVKCCFDVLLEPEVLLIGANGILEPQEVF
ncbi:MAG: UDP-N-acetylenolpyruvoylglucosamine reductase [Candidatus Celerinatantimonas neptuna]|nr:MAG: UDP-N-acetylenolpyruvoylglucosamine reductase [Candidatus Celerinatantimonas neptuna]